MRWRATFRLRGIARRVRARVKSATCALRGGAHQKMNISGSGALRHRDGRARRSGAAHRDGRTSVEHEGVGAGEEAQQGEASFMVPVDHRFLKFSGVLGDARRPASCVPRSTGCGAAGAPAMCFMCKSDGTPASPSPALRLVAEAAGTSRRVVTVDARAAMVASPSEPHYRCGGRRRDFGARDGRHDAAHRVRLLQAARGRSRRGGRSPKIGAGVHAAAGAAPTPPSKLARAAISLGARPLLECACRALAARRLHAVHADALEEALSSPSLRWSRSGSTAPRAARGGLASAARCGGEARARRHRRRRRLFSPSDIITT